MAKNGGPGMSNKRMGDAMSAMAGIKGNFVKKTPKVGPRVLQAQKIVKSVKARQAAGVFRGKASKGKGGGGSGH